MALLFPLKSDPNSSLSLMSLSKKLTRALSMSWPPKWVSPFVALTLKLPAETSMMVTSSVPPPKSKIRIVFLLVLPVLCASKPYARAAADGSLRIRMQSRPAILQACFVAFLYKKLKYAGTVTTHLMTLGSFSRLLAALLQISRILAEISSGVINFTTFYCVYLRSGRLLSSS